MIHFCRECGALNYHDAAPAWAVPCAACGAETPHQPHEPEPLPVDVDVDPAAAAPAPPRRQRRPRVAKADAVGTLAVDATS